MLSIYTIRAQIGQGGMATVYRAETDGGEVIAVKVLHADQASKDAADRFRAEATLATAIRHPNVIKVHGIETLPNGATAMAMEYLEGQTLGERMASFGPYTTEEALPILLRICAALQAAHARGIIHRDLKPENVFLCDSGEVKLLDFGISKTTVVAHQRHHTRTGMVVGTPAYMAPEQTEGAKKATHLSDIFALGVVACEMLTGLRPFDKPGAAPVDDDDPTGPLVRTIERYVAVRLGVEPQPTIQDVVKLTRRQRDDIGPEWVSSINAAISVDPANRPATVRTFIEPIYKATPFGDALVMAYAKSLVETSSAMDRTVPAEAAGQPTPTPRPAVGAPTVEGRATLSRHSNQSTIAQSAGQVGTSQPRRPRAAILVAGGVGAAALVAIVFIATRGEHRAPRVPSAPAAGFTIDAGPPAPVVSPSVDAAPPPADAAPTAAPPALDAGPRRPKHVPVPSQAPTSPDDIAP